MLDVVFISVVHGIGLISWWAHHRQARDAWRNLRDSGRHNGRLHLQVCGHLSEPSFTSPSTCMFDVYDCPKEDDCKCGHFQEINAIPISQTFSADIKDSNILIFVLIHFCVDFVSCCRRLF